MTAVQKLAADFRRWGVRRAKRVQELTKKYGVLCSPFEFSDRKKG